MDAGANIPDICPVCHERYKDPKVLPCFHILCRDCVKGFVVHRREKVLCPVERCRKEFTIPNNEAENLPDALPVYYKRDLKSLKSKIETQREHCCECMQSKHIANTAVAFCQVCQFLCEGCVLEHNQNLPDHELISYSELSQSDTDTMHYGILKKQRTRSFNQRAQCSDPKHYREAAMQYCHKCHVFVCAECEEKCHSNHKRMQVEEAAQECKQILIDRIHNIHIVHKRVTGVAQDVRTTKTSINDQQVALTSSIEHSFSRLTQILERRKHEMLKKLSNITQVKKTRLTYQEDELTRLAGELQRLEEYIESSLEMSTNLELLKSFKFIQEASKEILKCGSDLPIQPTEIANIAIKNNGESHLRDLSSKHLNVYVEEANASSCSAEGTGLISAETGKYAHFTINVVDKNHRACSSSQNVTAKLKCVDNDFQVFADILESNMSRYEASYCPQFRGEHQLTVLVNSNPIPGSPFMVTVTKPPLELGQSQGSIPGIKGPRGMTTTMSGNLLVCEWNGYKIIEIDKVGRPIREFGEGGLYHPAGIASSTDGSMFVTDAAGKDCCLVKFSSGGHLLKKIGKEGKAVGEFSNPRGIRVRDDKEVWICDRDNNRIQIFSLDLDFLHSIDLSQIDPPLEQTPKPNDINFNKTGEFFITDFANHCVLCYSASGDYLFSFSGNSMHKLHGPESIAIDEKDFLYVTESGNHCVSIFKSTGELVKTFGTLGKNDGEFKFPMGIIVDLNGSVFVAELLNNRIQMF